MWSRTNIKILIIVVLVVGHASGFLGFLFSLLSAIGVEEKGRIVITVDDGVNPGVLPDMLDFLHEQKISATFFFVGWRLMHADPFVRAKNQTLARHAIVEGHEIGNHTYGHGALCSMMPEKMRKDPDIKCLSSKKIFFDQVEKNSAVLFGLTGARPLFFRPPHWLMDEKFQTVWEAGDPAKKEFCDGYWDKLRRGEEIFPADKIYKEELICRGYLVQMRDSSKIAVSTELLRNQIMIAGDGLAAHIIRRTRETRDIDSGDYALNARYQKDPDGAVQALVRQVRREIAVRESAGIRTHVVTFHELRVSISAWKVLVPQWKKEGYRFIALRKVWGI